MKSDCYIKWKHGSGMSDQKCYAVSASLLSESRHWGWRQACLLCDMSCLNSLKLPFVMDERMGCPCALASQHSIPSLLHASWLSLVSPFSSVFFFLRFAFYFSIWNAFIAVSFYGSLRSLTWAVFCCVRHAEGTAAGGSPLEEQRGAWVTRLWPEPQDVAVSFSLSDLCRGSRELPDLWPGGIQHCVVFCVSSVLYFAGFFPTFSGIFVEGSD